MWSKSIVQSALAVAGKVKLPPAPLHGWCCHDLLVQTTMTENHANFEFRTPKEISAKPANQSIKEEAMKRKSMLVPAIGGPQRIVQQTSGFRQPLARIIIVAIGDNHIPPRESRMHPDHAPYFKFTTKARLDKAINSLLGIVEGIDIDRQINKDEIEFLRLWITEHSDLRRRHPLCELIPVVEQAIADEIFSKEEKQDVLWLCKKLRSTEYYDIVTADLQRLHALVGGIAADGMVRMEELKGLSDWLNDYEHLKTCWPYDEIGSLVTAVLRDKKIDKREHDLLLHFFSEFTAILDSRTIVRPKVSDGLSLVGLCAVCPEIQFLGSTFCFTGASHKYKRAQFAEIVRTLGGESVETVSAKLNYLIIGADGNPCWAYACYGRKVEKAVSLRKEGARLLLVHENDFHDAVADAA